MKGKIKVTVEVEGISGQFIEYISENCSCPMSQAMANVQSKLSKEIGRRAYCLQIRAW